ncbi:MAG: glycerophosphoryl diester phosphodiesterase membrane domain-containing protein, partial [Nanoarchaeota archaeon]|nr:glycerophosphoryl diester phosphodiesterase membrane domain-containing protein [Nanoarchaeota archaeon]
EQNYEYDAFKQMFNLNNLLLGAILFIVLIMGSLYLSCLAYLGVAGKIKRKSKELYGASLAFVPKYFIFQIIMGLIYLGPMIVIGTVVGFLFALNKVLGMIFLLLFILAMVAYFIWLAIKLIFATPALFLDDMGPIVAVKKSWNITKGKLGKVVILLLITAAMGVIGSSFVGEPMQSSFWSFAFHGSIFYLLLFLILSVISAAIAGLQVTFVMQAYDDIKGKK